MALRLDFGLYDASPATRPVPVKDAPVISGFYSGKWTALDGHSAWLDGGGSTAIFARDWAIGISGYRSRGSGGSGQRNASLGYGGLYGRYSLAPADRIHAAASMLIGYGGVGTSENGDADRATRATPVLDADALAEFNLTGFLRVAIGAGYRWVPVHFHGLGPEAWGGPTATVQWATGAF